jgi:cell wall-associated NlpC family hydrolase
MRAADVIACARTWIGTPWHHAACVKGVGVDCVHFPAGVCDELGIPRPVIPPYDRTPDGVTLLAMCNAFGLRVPRAEMQPADFVAIEWGDGTPHHVGFIARNEKRGWLSLIHADGRPGTRCVVEHRLLWTPKMKLVAAFRIPGVEP